MKTNSKLSIHALICLTLLLCSGTTAFAQTPTLRANGKIAFTSDRDGNREVYVMNPDGTNQVRLTNNQVVDDHPTWSPDGTKIAFVSETTSGGFAIFVMNADGTNKVEITPIVFDNPDPIFDTWGMSWSPDGNRIVFSEPSAAPAYPHDIFIVNIDGRNRQLLVGSPSDERQPAWSPDGSRILFSKSVSVGSNNLFTIRPDGTDLQALPALAHFDREHDFSPTWSPTGDKIAVQVWDYIDFENIAIANADGSNLFWFAGEISDKPDWSPDGSKIVFHLRDGGTQIYVQNVDGTGLTRLTDQPGNNFKPSWQAMPLPGPNAVQFSSATYSVSEGSPRADITLTRSGDTSGPASVSFATNDGAGLQNCDMVNGKASPRCDFENTIGTVQFAAGETSKSFSVAIVDDSYAEGNETFNINLTGASGTTLAAQSVATVMIMDNDTTNGADPIDDTNFFVRQQYIDFLGREPDPPGFDGWVSTINNCNGDTTQCDRVHVSESFFRSPEFQQRGYFTYRFYSVAFGRKPDYAEFAPDLARVSGFLDASQLEAAKVQFIADFMARPAFANTYDGLTNQQFVDTLLNKASVTLSSRQSMIDGLNNATLTRAQVLRQIVESGEVFTKYFNQSFAVMEYFGYLRRDPDAKYLDWIDILNQGGDSRSMVDGFVNSPEYRLRFGP